ncbi:MAG TPA: GAF domain-containing SpoIIE family protein phosphatase [Candidatus Acidoferrales bacterium]
MAKAGTSSRGRAGSRGLLRQLEESLERMKVDSDPASIARRVVQTVVGEFGFAGARLWRIADGDPAVWQQAGKLPEPDGAAARRAQSKGKAGKNGAVAYVSMATGGNGKAALVLEARAARDVSPESRHMLEIYSRFAGIALGSTERRRAVDELSSIIEATKQLNSTLDLGELINIILQIATRLTGAERGTVFLVDNDRGEIWSLVGLGLGQQEIRLPITKGIAGWVARSGETVNLEDAYNDPRFEPEVDRRLGFRTRALLGMPIRNKDDEVVGVLQLLNQSSGAGVFDSTDENFLGALSSHVALALEKAQLHRELLAKQRMERDLALARSIQSGLLPDGPPQIAGFDIFVSHRASQMVGGDYYDFVPLSAGTTLTVVADVEGKGVASALVMANLQATLRALTQHVHALERIVGSVNDMILTDTRGGKFMSMFVGLLDHHSRSFHYINAGHVPPAVVRANGEIVMLTEGGMVVGIFPGVPYERGHLLLQPGDILVACTDGITEAMNRNEDEYGNERLIATVRECRTAPAKQIVETVLADVDLYSRGGPHEDDRIIFILKVQ